MGLKAYKFNTTIETGHLLPMYLVFRTLVIDNDAASATLIFQGYPSQAERERQIAKGENRFLTFNLVLTNVDYLALFTQEVSGSLGLVISDIVWQLAKTIKFVADFEIDSETGRRVAVKKSLLDLNAEEFELPLGFDQDLLDGIKNRAAELFDSGKKK